MVPVETAPVPSAAVPTRAPAGAAVPPVTGIGQNRSGGGQCECTLQGDDVHELQAWAPKIERALREQPELADANSD
jgi:multidrug efflux pump subunit AcrB